jgi:putative transposase
MRDWPHSPVHRLSEAGTFMVTAGTYRKVALFNTSARLDFLCQTLFDLAEKYGWQLQAWAVFPNHYHFVAVSPPASGTLRRFIQHFHSVTAKRINADDATPRRQVWFEYWDTRLSFEKSYLARLRYVHQNAVHHGLVREATLYPWCSAGWFTRTANIAFQRTLGGFHGKGIKVPDDFHVEPLK